MAGLTYKGRPFDSRAFAKDLEKAVLERAVAALLEKGRAAAASLVDPETGRHALTFAWPVSPTGVRITTSGSEAYAMALEERLDHQRTAPSSSAAQNPVVYFAHASEDKAAAKPIAEFLLSQGVDVWFDQWEITAGDSLRRKMDAGLGACTHFVVLLSPVALTKPWVNEEIDAGFVRRVEGTSKFIPLRLGLALSQLPPLLKGMLSPEIDAENRPALDQLVAQIFGVSDKPRLGPKPRYVQRVDELGHFSTAAIAIGKYLAEVSETGRPMDPQISGEALQAATGLTAEDVELGVLDLVQAGLIRQTATIRSDRVWPLGPLFVTFDPHVHGWRPADDARTLAATMVNGGKDQYGPDVLATELGWSKRRMNAALAAVEAGDLANCLKFSGQGGWAVGRLMVTPQTRRAARSA